MQCPRHVFEFRQGVMVQGSMGYQHFEMEDSVLFLKTTPFLLIIFWFSQDLDFHGVQAGLLVDVAFLE